MEPTVKQKSRICELLYPFAANMLGISPVMMTLDDEFSVSCYPNHYCSEDEEVDCVLHKVTVECDFGKRGNVTFMPFMVFDDDIFEYAVIVNGDEVTKIGPMEWEVIRPKSYCNFTEYFNEMSKAVSAFQYLYACQAAHPFILKYYRGFFESFRTTLYKNVNNYDGKDMTDPVEITFNSQSIYGEPACEQVFIVNGGGTVHAHVIHLN